MMDKYVMPTELVDALRDLVAAAQDHKQATEAFLEDAPNATKTADALERAQIAVADAGNEVARIAESMGILPNDDDDSDPEVWPGSDRERFGSDHGL
jgi:hypothetical protein